MRICMVNSFYPPFIGGAETYVSSLARLLVKRGHEVTVYCAHNPLPPGETFEDGVRVRRMRAPFRVYGTPIAVSPINFFVEEYDVIHCNFPSPYLSSLFALFSKARGIPAVLTWHNDLPPVTSGAGLLVRIHDGLSQGYLSQYSRMIATTDVYARESPTLARNRNKVVVIPNGVDTRRFNPFLKGDAIREKHRIQGKKVVLFVGALTRWHTYKGLGNLIQAFGTVHKQTPDTHLLVVGGGELLARNRMMARESGLAEAVTFTGEVSEELLPEHYAASDLFVLPSLDKSEGFGLALLEAMACGKPVIGSKVGGVTDVIREGETGLLVSSNKPEELGGAIVRLLGDAKVLRRMGLAARKYAERHDWSTVAGAVEALYRDVVFSPKG